MEQTAYALSLRDIRKKFGRRTALDGLTLSARKGSILGVVGSNGAGKTTALTITAGLITPSSGDIDVLGAGPFDPMIHAGRVAILPQDSDMPPHALVKELLNFYATLQGISSGEALQQVMEVLDWVHLTDRANSKMRTLSHGMKRRVAIAQAFLGNPELVLLDEPMSGLDPREVVNIRELLRKRRNKQTILISSHNLHEVERICDRIAFIEHGKTIREDSMDAVTGQRQVLTYLLRPGRVPMKELHAALPDAVFNVSEDGARLSCHFLSESRALEEINRSILDCLLRHDAGIVEIRRGSGLENAYLTNQQSSGETAEHD